MTKISIPIIDLRGLAPPTTGLGTPESAVIGQAFLEAFRGLTLPADSVLEVFAVWAAAVIAVHPSTRELLERHFLDTLTAQLAMRDHASRH
jgi:hypothetical protein